MGLEVLGEGLHLGLYGVKIMEESKTTPPCHPIIPNDFDSIQDTYLAFDILREVYYSILQTV